MNNKIFTPQEYLEKANTFAGLGDKYTLEGNQKSAETQYVLAIEDCNRAIQLDPDYAEAYYHRSKLYSVLLKNDKAISDLTHILSLDVSQEYLAGVYGERGDFYFNQGQFSKAFEDYNLMVENLPESPQAYYTRAYKYADFGDYFSREEQEKKAQNNYRLAIEDCNRAIQLDPDYAEAYYHRSKLYSVLLKNDKAISDLTHILSLDVSQEYLAGVYGERGDFYFNQGQFLKAFEDYNLMVENLPESPQAYYTRANKYADFGDYFSTEEQEKKAQNNYRLAIEDCNRAIQLDPDYAEAYYHRSKLYSVLLKNDKAISDLTHILSLDVSQEYLASVYGERGDFYFNQGQFSKAFEDYNLMVENLPESPQAYYTRAYKYADFGDYFSREEQEKKAQNNYRLAIEDFNRAIQLDPDYAEAYYHRSKLYSVLLKNDKAISDLTHILSLDVSQEYLAGVYGERGDFYYNQGQFLKAFEDYNLMVENLPESPQAYYTRANKYADFGDYFSTEEQEKKAQNNYRLAIEDCNRAIQIDPDYADAYYQRSRLYSVLLKNDKAISDLTHILSLDVSQEYLAGVYGERGDFYYNQGQFLKAFEDYNLMVENLPESPQAYYTRAYKYADFGDYFSREEQEKKAQNNYRLAIEDCNRAIQLDPDYAEAYYHRSKLYSVLLKNDQAISDLTHILSLDLPEYDLAAIYNERGDLYMGHGQYAKAFEDYDLMVEFLPKSPLTHYTRANKYAALGDQFYLEKQEKKAQKNYHLAIEDCNRAIQLDPDYADAYYQRSMLFLALLENDKAISDLTHILSLDESEEYMAGVYRDRGDIYFHQEQYKKAFTDYGEMINLHPEPATMIYIRADKYATLGDHWSIEDQKDKAQKNYELALEDCIKAIEKEPPSLDPLILQARLLSMLDKYDQAINILSDLIGQDIEENDKGEIYYVRGDIQLDKGHIKEAFEDYEKMISCLTDKIHGYAIRADKYLTLGDEFLVNEESQNAKEKYRAALNDLSKVIKLDIENIDAYLLRSSIYRVLEDFDKAESDLNIIIDKGAPDEIMGQVFSTKGDIAFDKINYDEAFENYAEMIKLCSQNDRAYYDRATKYAIYGDKFLMDEDEERAKQQYHLALADFDKATKLNKDDIDYYVDRNTIYPFLEDWISMNKNSKALVKLAPENYEGYFGRGIALSKLNQDKKALDNFNSALKYSTGIPPEEKAEIYLERANVYEKQGNFKAALFNYETVVTFTPYDVRGHIGLGNCLISLEDYFEAAEKFESALNLEENNASILNGHASALIGIGNRYLELDELTKMQDAFESALRDCESSLEVGGDEFYTYYNKGLSLRSLMGYTKAIDAFDWALSIGEKEAVSVLPNIYFDKGEAYRLLGMEVDFQPDKSKNLLDSAVQIFKQGIESAQELNETKEYNDILSLLYESQGEALIELTQYEKALSSFQQSIKYDPDNLRTLIGKGRTFYLMKDDDKAQITFKKVQEIVKKNGNINNTEWLFELEWAYIGLGLIYKKKKNRKQAELNFEQGLQQQQQIPEFKRYINQANIFDDFKEINKAEEYRKKAFEKEKRSAFVNNEIAWMYVNKFSDSAEKLNSALKYAHRAVKLESGNNGNWLDTLGWIYFQMENYEEAEKYLAEAIDKNEYDDLIRLHYELAKEKVQKHRKHSGK